MLIHLHKQATTTPKVRAAIQSSDDAGKVLAVYNEKLDLRMALKKAVCYVTQKDGTA